MAARMMRPNGNRQRYFRAHGARLLTHCWHAVQRMPPVTATLRGAARQHGHSPVRSDQTTAAYSRAKPG